jgi:methyltransferase family protein
MTQQAPATPLPSILLGARDGLILHQTLYVAAKLGVADLLQHGWRSAAELARELEVDEGGLYRSLRLLASQGIFEENDARCFRNTQISSFLRTGVPGFGSLSLPLLGQRFLLSLLWTFQVTPLVTNDSVLFETAHVCFSR